MHPERESPAIAVVDDDPDCLLLARAFLNAAGFRVLTDDGAPGLAGRLLAHTPALLLLDLHLEGRDADDVLRELHDAETLRSVPVLGCTGARFDDPVLRRVAPVLAGIVHKPLDPTLLVLAVRRALGFEPPPALPIDDPDIAALRNRFLDGLPLRLARIQDAAAQGDRESLIHEVHRLRGAAAGFGFAELAALSGNLERQLRDDGTGDAQPVMAAVRALIQTGRTDVTN